MTQQSGPGADLRVAILTGMSGAGRSTAARAMEDLGWYVVDNMPPMMIQQMVELAQHTPSLAKLAVVIDARGGTFFHELEQALFWLRQGQIDLQVVSDSLQCLLAEEGFTDEPIGGCPIATEEPADRRVDRIVQSVVAELKRRGLTMP